MIDLKALLEQLETGVNPPISFLLDDEPARLEFQHSRKKSLEDRAETTLVYRTAQAPIWVILEATHVPACNLLTFRFRLSARKSPAQRISRVRILDLSASCEKPMLRGFNGGFVYDEDGKNQAGHRFPPREYRMWDSDLADEAVELEDLRGRSSVYYTPIWLLYTGSEGIWLGQEWSGSWRMRAGLEGDEARVWIELPFLDFKMFQGEEVQLPPVSMGSFAGSVEQGCVALRRTIYREFLPKINGQKPDPAIGCHAIGGSIPQFTREGLDREVDLLASLGVENLVFASCWYRPPTGTKTPFTLEQLREMFPGTQSVEAYEISAWWEQNGLLEADPSRFPDGLNAFADKLAQRNMLLGLWYDPRINVFTESHKNKGDFLIPYQHEAPNDNAWDMSYIDMGTESGRKFKLEMLEKLVVEHGASYLWHDMNTDPRTRYWNALEEDDRRGLKELRHFIGSDMVYDEFLRRHGHVWIEWCGGGGSMVNLGVLRRAHTLFIADYTPVNCSQGEEPNSDRARAYRTCLNWILPSTYITNFLGTAGAYKEHPGVGMHNFLSQFAGSLSFNKVVSQWSRQDLSDAARAIGLFRNFRRYLNKDYWSLFEQPGNRDGWDGWQFHDTQTRSGILVLFKQLHCREDTKNIQPQWIDDLSHLHLRCVEGQADFEMIDGKVQVRMTSKAALVHYDLIPPAGIEDPGWSPNQTL